MATVVQHVVQSDVKGDRSKDVTSWVIRGHFDASDSGMAKVVKALETLGLSELFDVAEDVPMVSKGKASDPRAGLIREWARENGIAVRDRGRLSIDIVSAYEKAVSNV